MTTFSSDDQQTSSRASREISDREVNEWLHLYEISNESVEDLLSGGESLENLENAGLIDDTDFLLEAREREKRIEAAQLCFSSEIKISDLPEEPF